MTFDEIKENWQQQKTGKLNIDSDLLLREVKRNKKHFESVIFWRDVREIGIAIPLCIFFLYIGIKVSEWRLMLLAATCAFVGIFMVVDRIIQKNNMPQCRDSLVNCINTSLAQVEHQIWLLKKVFWWYLLPPVAGVFIFIGHAAWDVRDDTGWFTFLLVYLVIFTLFVWGVYALNQWAVRKHFVPRQEELMQLQNSLQNSTE
ncbi:MAG: hypothetical protein ACYSWP_10400 [Planctomycetota bacterium]|jgi:hypothetical protein